MDTTSIKSGLNKHWEASFLLQGLALVSTGEGSRLIARAKLTARPDGLLATRILLILKRLQKWAILRSNYLVSARFLAARGGDHTRGIFGRDFWSGIWVPRSFSADFTKVLGSVYRYLGPGSADFTKVLGRVYRYIGPRSARLVLKFARFGIYLPSTLYI